ncbi:MAG: glycosyltransferase [Caldilineaceae bacterium]|nr:glycosyltransferase [Caldilineaceae bacterium]
MTKQALPEPIAVRSVDLAQPLTDLTDVGGYTTVKIFVNWAGRLLGHFELEHRGQPVSALRLRQAIADYLTFKVIEPDQNQPDDLLWQRAINTLTETYLSAGRTAEEEPVEHTVDLSQPLQAISYIGADQPVITVRVVWQNQTLGYVYIPTYGQPVTTHQLCEAIADNLGIKLLKPLGGTQPTAWPGVVTALADHFFPALTNGDAPSPTLPPHVPVSIVVATLDRPDDLRACLQSLLRQASPRPIEIVVVDNNPASGLTPPVVAEFPTVVLVNEARQGLAYARNAGFVACTGEIAIATDDDVIAPPDWVERLVAPFARSDVMVVTGNVLPYELETPAQHYFEWYGGLGRGFERFEVNGDWFESHRFFSVPTWRLGATANAAFRTTIFTHPEIGLMEESLGPGMPSGVGEDTYVFYKVLKAGYTVFYEPEAYVWHKHRRTMPALRKQLYNYSKGGVCYHLTLARNDGDLRGLVRIFCELPMAYIWRFKQWWWGASQFPLALILLEMWGNLMGFGAFFASRRRAKRLGRSATYIPVAQRQTAPNQLENERAAPTVQQRRNLNLEAIGS